jgi:DNA repair protein RecO (recombination protein O)
MIERAHGLILRTRPFTETSLIAQWLTPEFGRLSTIAKGARRPKSAFRGKLDLFYEADFSFNRSRRSELHTLAEVALRETHEPLRRDLGYLQQASYCAALVEQTTEKETPLPEIFELMRNFLAELPQRTPQPATIFAFELKLLNQLGQSPDLSTVRISPGARQIMANLTGQDWPALSRLKLSDAQAHEIQQFLHGFLIYHLGRVPKGRVV